MVFMEGKRLVTEVKAPVEDCPHVERVRWEVLGLGAEAHYRLCAECFEGRFGCRPDGIKLRNTIKRGT